ncbi:MAG: GntR family transcriptional regulator [Proteobacteria bacterium]|nr:GntR family transcriptional regulator [Pseudomonadota bacterium]
MSGRRHEKIVHALLKNIFRKIIKPGDKLPTERKLSENYNVDRSSLRIALKQLESMGVLDIRQRDGVYVKNYFKYAGIDFLKTLFSYREGKIRDSIIDEYVVEELLNFYIEFFPAMLRASLRQFSPRDVRTLLDLCEEALQNMDDHHKVVANDLKFLFLVAERTNNMVFHLIANSVAPIRSEILYFFLENISRNDLKEQIEIQQAIARSFMNTEESDATKVVEIYRKYLITQKKMIREKYAATHASTEMVDNFIKNSV